MENVTRKSEATVGLSELLRNKKSFKNALKCYVISILKKRVNTGQFPNRRMANKEVVLQNDDENILWTEILRKMEKRILTIRTRIVRLGKFNT